MQNNEQVILEVKVSKWSLLAFVFNKVMIFWLAVSILFIFVAMSERMFLPLTLLIVFFYFFFILLKYYLISSTYYVLTNQRVIKKRRGNKDSDFVPLKQIATVSTKRYGIFARIFNYGVINISTSGATEFTKIRDIGNPHLFSEEISKLIIS
ncbi:PH domain-containing protein [Liberiplasma polymorphum]|uniref:PH domain-containing protein n=1 Tax=Liberiplasma polymorphum TaxID=3374570 RepID=UPI003775F7BC